MVVDITKHITKFVSVFAGSNRVFIRRNKIYHLFYHDQNGKLISKTTKASTKAEANKFANNFFLNLKAKKSRVQEVTFSEYQDFYREYAKQRFSKSYQELVKYSFQQFSRVLPHNIQLAKISQRDVEKFVQLKMGEAKEQIINGYLRTLQAAFERGLEMDYLTKNIFKKVKRLKPTINPPLFLSKSEFQKIFVVEKDDQLKFIYRFAVYTGMRKGEIRFLKWSAIKLESNRIELNNHDQFTTKSKKSRVIPIHTSLKDDLLQMENQRTTELVFTKEGTLIKKDYISSRFKRVVIKAGLNPKYHFHSLRHTFASWLVQKGVSIYHVSKLLGHADVKTTEIYAHLRNDVLRATVELLE